MNQSIKKISRIPAYAGTVMLAFACAAEEPGVASATVNDNTTSDNMFCETALDTAQTQLHGFLKAYPDPTSIARSFEKGKTKMVPTRDWTSGFVAGSYW